MTLLWITEAVPMAATALLPLVFFPVFGVMDASAVAKLYGDPNVFLFMGGFMLAAAMEKWGLHKRFALRVIALTGSGPRTTLAGFMLATAFISMWVSNTATAAMVLPIGLGVVAHVHARPGDPEFHETFAAALMLGIAYAASIGGVATLIGTPPNMVFVGQAKRLLPGAPEVDFLQWFLFGAPLAASFLVVVWAYLSFVVMKGNWREDLRPEIAKELEGLGKLSRGEALVAAVFVLTAAAWITREWWTAALGLKGVHDGTVAIAAALVLFATPTSKKGDFLLDWNSAKKISWDVLLLFGGGFALAEGFQATGLGQWLSQGFVRLHGVPEPALLFALSLATIFVSELMSNTAQVTMMMPILAAAAVTMGVHPFMLMIPAALASSLAFMLPAGTPPNAIVFASGHLSVKRMAKAGFALNLLAAVWVTATALFLVKPIFGTIP